MKNYLLCSILLAAACSKGDAQPAPQPKPIDPPAPAKAPVKADMQQKPKAPVKAKETELVPGKPTTTAKTADGLAVMKAIGAKKADGVKLELNRKFVSITISPANGKKTIKTFCGDDDMKAFDAVPKQIVNNYGARVAAALADPDQGIRCEAREERVQCDVSAQDEHERALTFLIVVESWGPTLSGFVERETWMVDPDSAKYKNDLRERDATFAKATTQDCFRPESSRGRE